MLYLLELKKRVSSDDDLNLEKRFNRTRITKLNNEKSEMIGKINTLRKLFTTQFVSGTLDDIALTW